LDADLEKCSNVIAICSINLNVRAVLEYAARAESILQALGFDRESWSLETEKLSGGQQNRLGLVAAASRTRCALLDEPTNHLDVGAVEWHGGVWRVIQRVRHNFARSIFSGSLLPPDCRTGKWTSCELHRKLSDYLVEREVSAVKLNNVPTITNSS